MNMNIRFIFFVFATIIALINIQCKKSSVDSPDSNKLNEQSYYTSLQVQNHFINLYQNNLKATFTIGSKTSSLTLPLVTKGTGFFISDDGYAITCYHVVLGSDEFTIRQNGTGIRFSAVLVNESKENDLALLKINLPDNFKEKIPYIQLSLEPFP